MRIFLEKPNIADLATRFNCFDMHVHTKYSDTYTRPEKIVENATDQNIHFAITDHNEIRGIPETIKNNTDRIIVPGIEVGCNEGPHILFYFYDYPALREFFLKSIKPYRRDTPFMNTSRPANDVLDDAEKFDCIAVAAHPHAPPVLGVLRAIKKGYLKTGVLNRFDAVEVICGAVTERMNLHAVKFAYEFNKGFTGGSDSHTLKQLGGVVTCSKADDVESLLKDVINHKTRVVGKGMKAKDRVFAHTKTVSKHLSYPSTVKLRAQSMISKPIKHRISKIKERRQRTR
ncbi:PHP domain-containing protein [Nanoarchaeota archaeon]